MKSLTRASLAAVLIVVCGVALSAQAPAPLTADQLRVQIASLEQQLATLREQLRLTRPAAPAPALSPLAAAAAQAATVTHTWAVSTNTAYTPVALPAIVLAPGAPSESATYQTIARKDEAYWKARMQDLQATRDADRTMLAGAVTREAALDKRLHVSVDNSAYIADRLARASVDSQWQQAVAEVTRLKATVVNDQRAMTTAEEEARRANVPAGWLRP